MNNYLRQNMQRIKKAKDNKEIADILNKVYSDGFEDGVNDE